MEWNAAFHQIGDEPTDCRWRRSSAGFARSCQIAGGVQRGCSPTVSAQGHVAPREKELTRPKDLNRRTSLRCSLPHRGSSTRVATINSTTELLPTCGGIHLHEHPVAHLNMTRIIAIFNEKGGTAKTTTTVNLAHALARTGKRVLLVDLDPQGNATHHLGVHFERGIYHLFTSEEALAICICGARKNLDVLPANVNLFAAALAIQALPGREFILRDKLQPALTIYDFVLIDCAPSLSTLTHNALAAAHEVIVPVAMDYLSHAAIKGVERTTSMISRAFNHDVQITGIVPTFFHSGLTASREILALLQEDWREKLLPAIRVCSKLRETPKHQKTIFEYAPGSRGAADYEALTQAIIKNGGDHQ